MRGLDNGVTLRALPTGRALILHRRLQALDITHARFAGAMDRARSATDRMNTELDYERRSWLLWGQEGHMGLASGLTPSRGIGRPIACVQWQPHEVNDGARSCLSDQLCLSFT